MLSNFRFLRGRVSRILGFSALSAILFVAGCTTAKNSETQLAVSHSVRRAADRIRFRGRRRLPHDDIEGDGWNRALYLGRERRQSSRRPDVEHSGCDYRSSHNSGRVQFYGYSDGLRDSDGPHGHGQPQHHDQRGHFGDFVRHIVGNG